MIELVLTAESANRVRFGISPLEETLGAMQTLLGQRGHPSHLPWLREAAAKLPSLPIADFARVMSARHYITDFLSPPPSGPETTATAQLAEIRRTPPEQVALELSKVDAELGDLPQDPAEARDLLAAQMEIAWTELVEPHWPRMRRILVADIEERSRRLAAGGIAQVLEDIHPRVRLVDDVLVIEIKDRSRIRLDRRGLLLMPGVFAWPSVGVITMEPWQPSLLYPARGVAELWSDPERPPDPLTGVLGRTKAALLTTLNEPASTTELARRLGFSAPTVSQHLTAMRAAGLLDTKRHGREVRYQRTELGDALLRA